MISNVMEGVAVSFVGDSAVATLAGGVTAGDVTAGIVTTAECGGEVLVVGDAAVDGPGMTITFPVFAGFAAPSGNGTELSFVAGNFDASSVAAAIGVAPEFLAFRKVTVESNETCWI